MAFEYSHVGTPVQQARAANCGTCSLVVSITNHTSPFEIIAIDLYFDAQIWLIVLIKFEDTAI